MKIAIVGTSKLLTPDQLFGTVNTIAEILGSNLSATIISGGALGVDTLVEQQCKLFNRECKVYRPENAEWGDLDTTLGYKARNMQIAEECDKLYCITVPMRKHRCYHCDSDTHEKTGGCWTAKQVGLRCKVWERIIIG